MVRKIIKLGDSGCYFLGFDSKSKSHPIQTTDPLKAFKFIPREHWHEEEYLNETIEKLEALGFNFKVQLFEYTVHDL